MFLALQKVRTKHFYTIGYCSEWKEYLLAITVPYVCWYEQYYIINFIDITPRFLPVFAEKFSFEYLLKSHKIPLFSNKLVTDYIRSLTLACTAA